jgi:hypothetical protein
MKEPLMSERNTRLSSIAIVILIWSWLIAPQCLSQSIGLVGSKDVSPGATPLKQVIAPVETSIGSSQGTPPRSTGLVNGGEKIQAKPSDVKPKLDSQKKPGVLRSAPKQEKKQIKMEGPTPIGRPDLKPEFARPDRAPGPPLGDRSAEEKKK